MAEQLEGYVEHIVFRNEENGYTVLELGNGGKTVCCVGSLASVSEGEFLTLTGGYTVHSIYGEQFKIEGYTVQIPREVKALERYLGSGAVKGIGAALAGRIVKRFGDETLRILEEEPERLAEVKGISMRKAREIAAAMAEKSQLQSDMIFLSGYGISLNLCLKIHQKFQDKIYDILQENPYRLAEEIDGIGFKTADAIAAKAGIRTNAPCRIKSGFLYVLNLALGQGHIYLPREILFARTGEILQVDPEELDKYFMDLILEKKIVVKQTQEEAETERSVLVYAYQNYYLELRTAAMLKQLNVRQEEDPAMIRRSIENMERNSGIHLDELQEQAVETAAQNGISILTGGPGTGKTTTINAMIRYFEALKLRIVLAAPTGRAAKRMQEATGYEASTIHRLLELYGDPEDPSQKARFARNEDNPLEADVIIIDETSMVDLFLMNALLKAVVPLTRLVFVGDVSQLPSVGPGRVLADLIDSGEFPVIRLTKIFRQAALSDIVVNAHRINNGEHILLDNRESRDFFFLERGDVRVILKIIVTLIRDKLPAYLGIDRREIQVLTPMRKGALGVENLNVLLQKYLNPPAPEKPEYEAGNTVFRTGDKVMQIKNNYQLEWEIRGKHGIVVSNGAGIFNGDMGVVETVDSFSEILTVVFDDGRTADYSFKQLDELELAYAVTVHKAQGSEYAAVVMPLLAGPKMLLTRNLLYTAVTRAKNCVVLVGSSRLFQSMVDNRMENDRYTTLARRIMEMP